VLSLGRNAPNDHQHRKHAIPSDSESRAPSASSQLRRIRSIVAVAMWPCVPRDISLLENETIIHLQIQERCIAVVLKLSDQDANCHFCAPLDAHDNLARLSAMTCQSVLLARCGDYIDPSWSSGDFRVVVPSERLLGQREGRSIRFRRLNATPRLDPTIPLS
jgi:hypothetical protein